jgi:serine phosphatase RsbU (regulator of sigma subunit)/anti-sigma regulatory factor (Ser/Thr protein kinase)
LSTLHHTALEPTLRLNLRLKAACHFGAVREAARYACQWLASQHASPEELAAWELALVEAGNNAVEHSPSATHALPIEFEISCGEGDVEARVTDHTLGFDLPEEIGLPDMDSEGGRGLFLIKSMTDQLGYLRGCGENTLVMRRKRSAPAHPEQPDPLELQRRLALDEIALADMSEELSTSYESLVAIFRYSDELGRSADLRDFSRRLLNDLKQLTEADTVIVRMLDPDGTLELFEVLPEELMRRPSQCSPEHQHCSVEWETIRTHEDVWFGSEKPLHADDPVRAVSNLAMGLSHSFGFGGRLLGTITLGRYDSRSPFRSAQINLIHTFIDFLAIQIMNSRLVDERTRARVTRHELDIAANIQRSLLPVALVDCRPFEMAASCQNAREVGGDFYDVIRVGEEGLFLVIADVMGKGVPAALFGAMLRIVIRSMPMLFNQPASLLSAVNRVLYDDLSRVDMFITAKVVFLDFRHTMLVSASAGHCPLMVCCSHEGSAREADDSGLPLGIETTAEYVASATPFPPGQLALLYTDGLTESRNPAGEMFGVERLAWTMTEAANCVSLSAAGDCLLSTLAGFQAGAPQADDQTFILLGHAL